MASNKSDDFFNSFAAPAPAPPVKKTPVPIGVSTTGTSSKATMSGAAAAGGAAAAAAAAYHAASSGMPPPPPVRATASNPTGSLSRSAARPPIRTAASRPTGMTGTPAATTAAAATTTSSGSTGNAHYYGAGAATYNNAIANSSASSTAATATTMNPSYYTPSSTVSASANANANATTKAAAAATTSSSSTSAPNPYSGYATSVAPAPPPAFNYGAPTTTTTAAAASSPYNYGQPNAGPQVMNPYLLSSAAPTDAFSGAMDTNATFSGPMDTGASAAAAKPSTFIPQLSHNNAFGFSSSTSSASSILVTSQPYNPADFEDEPPLLEELGINIEHIVAKMRSVVLPFSRFKGTISDATVIQDADLAGPIALGLLLGGELMLSGKLQFGYIYGFGLFGCISMTLVLNFMSPHDAISVWTVTSILGYSLLPVNLLAAVKLLVVNLGNFQLLGQFLGFLTVLWCTVASTRLMEQGCDMRDQRYLIAYPIGLLYTAFVMITIF